MRTSTLRTVADRALWAFGALITIATIATASASPAMADQPATPADEKIFEARLEAGYRAVDTEGSQSLLSPYDPLTDGPVLGLDLLYLTPGFGTLRLEAGFLTDENWRAEAEYNHGADVDVEVSTQTFTHDTGHLPPVSPVNVYIPPPLGSLEVEGSDADPGREYRSDQQENRASVRVRVPGYPAHVRADGRIYTRRGDEQMRYFFRSCSTHLCHMDSRKRDLDQETREYTLGFDAHAGPVDIAYSHAVQTFSDDAADPVVAVGNMLNGRAAGDYEHDVNPDLRFSGDRLSLNTNLTNRVVLSAAYDGGEQRNETSDISRRTRNAGATASWRLNSSTFLVGRYTYDEERSGDLGAEARALREKNSTGHANASHKHVLDPERTRHTAEISTRFSPVAKVDVGARLRYRARTRHTLIEKETDGFDDEYEKTRSTLAALDGRFKPAPTLSLEASLGREWTDSPLYSIETTELMRYGLGGSWTPSPVFLFRATWQGFRGKNDDAEALQYAYAGSPKLSDPERSVHGDSLSIMASFVPAPAFSLTASWTLTDNDVEQDMIFGNVSNYGFSYLSPDTDWSGRSQVASLQARWKLSRRLTLTAGGSWVESLERYTPTFEEGDGLEEASTVEFTKLLGSLEAEVRLTDAVGLTLAAFWAKYDDRVDDADDATARGLLAAVGYRW